MWFIPRHNTIFWFSKIISSPPPLPRKRRNPLFTRVRTAILTFLIESFHDPLSPSSRKRGTIERERENSKNRRVSASRDVKIFLDNIVCRLWNFSLDCGTSGEYHYRRIKKLREGVEQRCCNSVRGRASPPRGTLTMLRREKEIRAALPLCLPDLHAEYRAAQICF